MALFTLGLFCVKCPGEDHKSYDSKFLHGNTPKCQILIWLYKIFTGFNRFWPVKRLKVLKTKKIKLLSIFCCQDI